MVLRVIDGGGGDDEPSRRESATLRRQREMRDNEIRLLRKAMEAKDSGVYLRDKTDYINKNKMLPYKIKVARVIHLLCHLRKTYAIDPDYYGWTLCQAKVGQFSDPENEGRRHFPVTPDTKWRNPRDEANFHAGNVSSMQRWLTQINNQVAALDAVIVKMVPARQRKFRNYRRLFENASIGFGEVLAEEYPEANGGVS
jgi:hypothetical protein